MTDAGRAGVASGDSLWLRFASGAVFVPIFLYLTWVGGGAYLGFVSLMVLLGLIEFYEMLRAKGERPYRVTGVLAGLILLWLSSYRGGIHTNMLVTLVLIGLMAVELFRRDNRGALHNISGTIFGVFYVAWLGGHLLFLRAFSDLPIDGSKRKAGAYVVFYLFMCVWGCDTFAYLTGRLFGKRRLLPRVSPNKSVEGAIGGLVAGGLLGALSSFLFADFLAPWLAGALGVLLALAGQIGDMVESLLKRDTERKDSAAAMIIPGHGGVLDRFDSILFAAPILYYVLKAIYA